MNERIKELAEQAGMNIVNDQFSTYGKFAEKFAELIVRECAGIAHGSDQPSVDIKYYFGVEE
jgi:hypothetical protein